MLPEAMAFFDEHTKWEFREFGDDVGKLLRTDLRNPENMRKLLDAVGWTKWEDRSARQ
jgi:hypothetical protein